MRESSKQLWVGSASALALLLTGAPALAQVAPDVAADTDDETVLDRVTVTARKREESLQSTPIAVTALTESVVESLGAEDLDGIEKLLPNVELSPNAFSLNTLNASIRGNSFADLEKTFEPTVGVSIDGVFLAWNTGALFDLEDVEQIEVLRGPQGTLYGRNTTAGTINIRRTKPTGEYGLKSRVRFGSHNQLDYNVVANAPIIEDKLALKLTYNRQSNDNFQKDIYTGEQTDGIDVNTFGGALYYTPSETFDALLSLDYSEDDSTYPSPLNQTRPDELFCQIGFFGFGEPTACGTGSFDVSEAQELEISTAGLPQTNVGETFAATLEMNWDVASGTVTSVTGFREIEERLTVENSGTALLQVAPGVSLPLFVADRPQDSSQFSQELRYASDFQGPFNFVAGLFAMQSEYDIFPAETAFGTAQVFVLGAPANTFTASQELNAYAAFGEATFDVTDKLRLTAGARLSYEEKDFEIDTTVSGTAPFMAADSESWTEPTWRVIADYQFTDDVFGYASYSRGFRSGGFNGRGTSPGAIGPYDPETVDSYEVGLRTEFFNNTVRVNPTFFFYEYKDKQEEGLVGLPNGGTETIVANAAAVDIWGFELEALAQPTSNLTLRAALGTLDYEYNEFEALDNRPLSPTFGQVLDVTDTVELRRAPELTVTLGGDLVIPTNWGDVVFNTNYRHRAEQVGTANVFEADPRATEDAQDIVDASAKFNIDRAVTGLPMDLALTVWGRDVFGDVAREGSSVAVAGTFFFTNVAPSRVFGVDLAVEF